MLLIYITMSNGHNTPGNSENGHLKATFKLPNSYNSAYDPQQLNWTTAPRSVEDISANGILNGPSFHEDINKIPPNNQFTSPNYNYDNLDPTAKPKYGSAFKDRPDKSPYYLFFGKFGAQKVSNIHPKIVGHVDIKGENENQQPSNIYNIPDFPKPYTLIQSANISTNQNNGSGGTQKLPETLDNTNSIVYDASSCPVNWRIFGPVKTKVNDIEVDVNDIISSGKLGKINGGKYKKDDTGVISVLPFPPPFKGKDISGIYFDTDKFEVEYKNDPNDPLMFVGLKEEIGGGAGTDISFNNYFFKQPEMPRNCDIEFVPGNGGAVNDSIHINWEKPFNRKAGTRYGNNGVRYFFEKNLQQTLTQENWLPHFSELVLDISGGPHNRKFCLDSNGNFVHENGVDSSNPYALLSANNTRLILEATISATTTTQGSITDQYDGGKFSYFNSTDATFGRTTIITDRFPSTNSDSAVFGGAEPNQVPDLSLGGTYDIAIYYRNESVLKTTKLNGESLPEEDLYYNNHNVCLKKNIIFGIPGFIDTPKQIKFWSDSSLEYSRYYMGGEGPDFKDVRDLTIPMGLNLPWTNTSIIAVGYDCSLNVFNNTVDTIQINGINTRNQSLNPVLPITANYYVKYNIDPTGTPVNIIPVGGVAPNTLQTGIGTKKWWPNGDDKGGITENAGNALNNISSTDYIKEIDILTGVPIAWARDHPEFRYTVKNYNAVNDTKDKTTGLLKKASNLNTYNKVIPIWPRSVCNTKNKEGYNNMMVELEENAGDSGVTFGIFTVKKRELGVDINITPISARTRNKTNKEEYDDVYFLNSPDKLIINENKTLNQLANYGDVSPDSSTLTQNTLVPSDSLVGRKGAGLQNISDISLDIQKGNGSTFGTGFLTAAAIVNNATIQGWDSNYNLYGTLQPNVDQTISNPSSNPPYVFTFNVSKSIDIGEDEINPPIEFSNKRGYYLGFDISNVEIVIDPYFGTVTTNSYKQTSTDYDQYKISMTHTAKTGPVIATGTQETVSSLSFRMGDKPTQDLSITNVILDDYKDPGIQYQNFFGVKRLPASQLNTDFDQSLGGQGLEIQVEFTIDNLSDKWIPIENETSGNDEIARVEYVINPGTYSSPNNFNSNEIAHTQSIKWTDIPQNTPTWTITSFFEIHEGVDAIVDGYPYSRDATDKQDPLLGLKEHQFSYSNNITRNNINIDSSPNYNPLQSQLEVEELSKFTSASGAQKELFWDYTWPVITGGSTQELPDFIDDKLTLLHIETGTQAAPVTQIVATKPWGGTQFSMIDLENLIALGGSSIKYKHNFPLPNEQSMWCNYGFEGPLSVGSVRTDHPYIDYTNYFNEGSDYSQKKDQGSLIGGINVAASNLVNNSFSTTFPQENVKWLLFEVEYSTDIQTNGGFFVRLKNNNTTLELGTDYFLFYCEKKDPNAGTKYKIETASGVTTEIDYSSWLNPIGDKTATATTIKCIDYSNSISFNEGNNNGCGNSSALNQKKNVGIKMFQTDNEMRIFICIGLLKDIKVTNIEISATDSISS